MTRPQNATHRRPGWDDVRRAKVDIAPAGETDFRRRRTGVCACLRMDGAPVDYAGLAAAGLRLAKNGRGGNAITVAVERTFTCTVRSTLERIPEGYMSDVCTSSWSKACPFKAEA